MYNNLFAAVCSLSQQLGHQNQAISRHRILTHKNNYKLCPFPNPKNSVGLKSPGSDTVAHTLKGQQLALFSFYVIYLVFSNVFIKSILKDL